MCKRERPPFRGAVAIRAVDDGVTGRMQWSDAEKAIGLFEPRLVVYVEEAVFGTQAGTAKEPQ